MSFLQKHKSIHLTLCSRHIITLCTTFKHQVFISKDIKGIYSQMPSFLPCFNFSKRKGIISMCPFSYTLCQVGHFSFHSHIHCPIPLSSESLYVWINSWSNSGAEEVISQAWVPHVFSKAKNLSSFLNNLNFVSFPFSLSDWNSKST